MKLVALFCAIVVCTGVASAATFGTKPGNLEIDPTHPIAQVSFSSLNALTVNFDVTVQRWTQVQGSDVFAPVPDSLVVPPIFSIQPYESKPIRVTFRTPQTPGDVEASYMVIFTEIVPPTATAKARVVQVPLFVPPHAPSGEPTYKLRRISATQAELIVSNPSNAHVYIGKLTITSSGETVYDGTPSRYILAGGSAVLPLKITSAITGSEAELNIENETGESRTVQAAVTQ
ncbi:MAG TPA: fimbria/pilus periplasmic chaperone [Candidatus Rubrimentiphilum sp.]|nr:fimbria/pilus periplasmic chaperone [Candidatus Rubrimentiphilum sp.]